MSDDTNGSDGLGPSMPASLLPYDRWMEDAQRIVMIKALDHVSEHGLPGDHHFYMTFRTDMPGVDIPSRLKDRYPEEMTIVLQHQFQNLTVDHDTRTFSVGLSFGGIPSTLHIPLGAVTAFADPHIHLVMHFTPQQHMADADTPTDPDLHGGDKGGLAEVHTFHPSADEPKAHAGTSAGHDGDSHDQENEGAKVVSLAAFRKKPSGNDPSGTPDDRDR
ncbi:hypothetical protein CO583_08635 [Parasaccharibacter sp. TMW2.1882]|uniref:Stringent starvation protein B n=1 Tax=Parasaccharibacter apium TaxID=1510841 RepID=A0A7U7G504_9PROT|nr:MULTISPECIES: ClpXP protease specificity-enhancing factor SspB [Acetobacteraceae]MCL1563261.1 hypothetical protein [Parasaccharibacter sp. TMW 2.1886]MCQ0042125.1 ClpXP protease specificity-enhancing factor SspB [Bombella sp.]MUG80101.1 hypothetical protein [Bombella sp. ESL0380]MUH03452.1 hypothetical protein [Bombella sp. ESL0387]QGT75677.1 hypothetical protein GN304_08095 [Bombella sp. ESL0368]